MSFPIFESNNELVLPPFSAREIDPSIRVPQSNLASESSGYSRPCSLRDEPDGRKQPPCSILELEERKDYKFHREESLDSPTQKESSFRTPCANQEQGGMALA
jgi:hypothetical protein